MRSSTFLLGFVAGLGFTAVAAVVLVWSLAQRPIAPDVSTPPVGGEVQLRFEETFLSRMADEQIRREQPAVRRAWLDVQPAGRLDLVIQAELEVFGRTGTVDAKAGGTVLAKEGRLDWVLTDISVGGLTVPIGALPESLRLMLQTPSEKALQRANAFLKEAGLELTEVHTDDGILNLALKDR